ncbi:hypothetical protein [Peptoniphilus stercorisuis]|uniref:Lipoprotein n=1 Tax=Peptoniphilus stercorisuis TaxID=1436965 RepID=A0ABS4KDE3_9FIRM|nr:hypothetical protein [Peptoniphilus stercorisuis]MBP2025796.1 hypothetical protein [Peptoniphilus stercorisuis]
MKNLKKGIILSLLLIVISTLTSCNSKEVDSKQIKEEAYKSEVVSEFSIDEEENKFNIADVSFTYPKDLTILFSENKEDSEDIIKEDLNNLGLDCNDVFPRDYEENSEALLVKIKGEYYPMNIRVYVSQNPKYKNLKNNENEVQDFIESELEKTFDERTKEVEVRKYRLREYDAPLISCRSEYKKEYPLLLKSSRVSFIYKDKLYMLIFTTLDERFAIDYNEFKDFLNTIEFN